jgi:lathosterol oxidase
MSIWEKLQAAFAAAPIVALKYGFWYVLLAGFAWFLTRVLFRRASVKRRIAAALPTLSQMGRETLYSIRSLMIFGAVGGFVAFAAFSGWTRMYGRFDERGWIWFIASIALAIALHDTYFYWTHRLMHHRRLYRLFHHTHHLSTNPSPWAAYSFSPLEALVQAGIGPLIIFTIPIHPLGFLIFMTWQIAFNVLGHCGHEIFPSWFVRSWCGRVLNTPTHHAMHHEKFRANYSLYFNVWDRLMGTNHRQYAERFAEITTRS